jgi:hypothetical protein
MSGIQELFTLLYWVNNDKKTILETSFKNKRPVSNLQKAVEKSLRNKVSSSEKKHVHGQKNKFDS